MAEWDFRELEVLARDLDAAGPKAAVATRQVVKRGAQKVKERLQREASGIKHAPGLPAAISYDVELRGDVIEAEIGPERGGAGSLALLYLGNSRLSPPLPDPMLASDAENEVMSEFLARVGEESLG